MKYNQLGNGSALKELYVTDDIEMYNDQIETKSFDINWPLIYTIKPHWIVLVKKTLLTSVEINGEKKLLINLITPNAVYWTKLSVS